MADEFIFDSDELITFCHEFDNMPVEEVSESILEVNLQDLNERWTNLQKSYRSFRLGAKRITPELLESAQNKLSNCTKVFHSCKASILDLQKSFVAEARSKLNEDPVDESTFACVSVPPCDTDIFYGGYEEWPSFRDMFSAVYIDNPRIPPVQKLYHLRLKVQGQAGGIIRKYKLCSQNFSLAWQALKDRYENQRILVENQIKILLNLPSISVECSESLQNIQCTINDCLAAIKAQDVPVGQWDPFIIMLCSSKLPRETLSLWEQSLESHKTLVNWEKMDKFLSHRCEVVERLESRTQDKNSDGKMQKVFDKPRASKQDCSHFPCKICHSNHALKNCSQFLNLDPQGRNKFVTDNKICLNCLAYTHSRRDCPSKFSCSHCKKNHHSLLHFPRFNAPEVQRYENPSQVRGRASGNYTAQINQCNVSEGTLLPTAIVKIHHQGEMFNARAFLDQGSEKTFISKRLQQQLMLPTERRNFQIHGIGGQVVAHSNSLCHLTLYSNRFNRYINIQAIVVPKITRMLPSSSLPLSQAPFLALNSSDLADPEFHLSSRVELLIGSNVLPQIFLEGTKTISPSLLAQFTIFGWVISGSVEFEATSVFSIGVSETISDPIADQLKMFWEHEEIPVQHPVSAEDQFCEDLFQKTTFRNEDGRYVVKLPFKSAFPEEICLGSSRSAAKAQYFSMERNLNKKLELAETYKTVLNEYLSLNHMKPTFSEESRSSRGFNSFYLPHHAVVKPESRSTKVRVVFNASKKTSSGISLNDILHVGPTLQADLMNLILKWRFYRYVFNGDIEKMYRQILVHKEDTQFQRILFRSNPNGPIQDYALQTVTFGVNCAPYLAIRTLIQLAKDSEVFYPKASYILNNETYVDDILSGAHDKQSAIDSLSQLITVLKSAGFPLKKITSNCQELLASVPNEDVLDSEFLKFAETSSTKTLGIQWNALSDCFSYRIEPIFPTPDITKRQILSHVAKLFDPAGWISPVVIQAKMLLQQLWLDGTGWDDKVKPRTLESWNKFIENLPIISTLKIPRWIGFTPSQITQIHGFCDASEKAYCAAIYFRIKIGSAVSCHLLVAKTKVAPINPVSLPRLELCGAVLLSQLIKQITCSLPCYNCDLYLWTDSSIVLGWLEKPPKTWKTYVANRTSQIIQNVGNVAWRHVRSGDNPADLGSRGCSTDQLLHHSLWWAGPDWLQKSPEEWPQTIILKEHSQESKQKTQIFHLCAGEKKSMDVIEDILNRFSKWDRAIRVMTYVYRFLDAVNKKLQNVQRPNSYLASQAPNFLSIKTNPVPLINHQEFSNTKLKLLRLTQLLYYPEEYQSLIKHKKVNQKSSLYPLSPYLDESNVIRANGRISNANLPFNERYPIILHVNSRFCKLFIDYTHNLLMHAETNLMLRAVRGEYYVPRLRTALRFHIRRCFTCIRYKKQVRSQLMGALPKERSTFSIPFTTTGIDFAGPFSIKTSTVRNSPYHKGYVCVFVCFCTKAIHLELCSDLTSGAFQAAFTRFIGRRGLPKKVMTDNGTNFVGAERSIRNEFEEFCKTASKDIAQRYAPQGLQWSFIPPNAPHMGGLWEAGVKSFKMHFKKVAQRNKYTFEEFSTLLARIESVLNSRPLSPMSDDPNELLALTPGHFLCGAPLQALPENPTESLTLRDRWEKVKILHHQFAQRWKDEYLKELHKRYKWQHSEENIKVGQLAIIKDDLLPPTEWKLSRIVRIYYGNDGLVRVADLKTQFGIITRAIAKLCILPLITADNLE